MVMTMLFSGMKGTVFGDFPLSLGSVVAYRKSPIRSHASYVSTRLILSGKNVHGISHYHIQAIPVYKPWLVNEYR